MRAGSAAGLFGGDAPVEGGARGLDPLGMLPGPLRQGGDRAAKVVAHRRQRIFDLRRRRGRDRSGDEAVALEVAQREGQHLLRDARDLAPDRVEAHRAARKGAHREQCPLVADPREKLADLLAGAGYPCVTWFHEGAFLRFATRYPK